MRWLIVEDALVDRKGHWFEYLSTFARELCALGDDVTILADRSAEPFLVEQLRVRPVLPASIWHRMSDGAGGLKRYWRLPAHAWKTFWAVRRFVAAAGPYDVVFVPTVLVHHLLGWVALIKTDQIKIPVLLFFPNLPIHLAVDGTPTWNPSPTTRLLHWLLRRLRREVEAGRVILGVETHSMRQALATLTGLSVTYFPHPVAMSSGQAAALNTRHPDFETGAAHHQPSAPITMACYGPARHEKGSDILAQAIVAYFKRFPETRVRFVFQWMEDFRAPTGEWVRLDATLLEDKRVEVVPRYFADGEYSRYLAGTDVMLLPYRKSSYALRVSRVVIEAITAGLPVVATHGTSLFQQAAEFGSCVGCDDGEVDNLVQTVRQSEIRFEELRCLAKTRRVAAQTHFSVSEFKARLQPLQRTVG